MHRRNHRRTLPVLIWRQLIALVAALCLLAATARANAPVDLQAETAIGPGTTLRQFHVNTGDSPQRIGVITVDLANQYIGVRPAFAGPPLAARATVADQARHNNSAQQTVIAAVNGDFFDTEAGYAGIAVGALVIDGELLLNPWGPALGIMTNGTALIGHPNWAGRVELLDEFGQVEASHPVAGVNRRRETDSLIIYTSAYGPSTATNTWGAEVVLRGLPLPLTPAFAGEAAVTDLLPGQGDTPLPGGSIVLSGHGRAGEWLAAHLLPGRRARLVFDVEAPWDRAHTTIGGQPILLTDGQIAATAAAGPLADAAAPRTAAGIDADGRLILVTVDGRQADAIGLTLPQFAQLLQALGLKEAINLDGGGSTTLYARPPGHLDAAVLNRPADGTARRVGNSLQVVSRAPAGRRIEHMWLEATATKVLPGTSVHLIVRGQDEFANPVDFTQHRVHYATIFGEENGRYLAPGRWLALAPGEVHLLAQSGSRVAAARLAVLGPDELEGVQFRPATPLANWALGQEVELGLAVFDQDGLPVAYDPATLIWTAEAGLGTMESPNRLTIGTESPGGRLRADLSVPGPGGEEKLLPLATWTLAVEPGGGGIVTFPDTLSHWARRDIYVLTQQQIVRGYPDGRFQPDAPVTRAEMALMLVGALTKFGALPPAPEHADPSIPFADADLWPEWAGDGIARAAAEGLIGGFEDGTFRARLAVTREQAVAMLVRAAELVGFDLSVGAAGAAGTAADGAPSFTDAGAIGDWASESVRLAHRSGLVHGLNDGSFQPKAELSRSQAAALLVRLLGW